MERYALGVCCFAEEVILIVAIHKSLKWEAKTLKKKKSPRDEGGSFFGCKRWMSWNLAIL